MKEFMILLGGNCCEYIKADKVILEPSGNLEVLVNGTLVGLIHYVIGYIEKEFVTTPEVETTGATYGRGKL